MPLCYLNRFLQLWLLITMIRKSWFLRTTDGFSPLVTNQAFEFPQCSCLDCTVRALHIFVILFNRLAIFNRDTSLFRAAKVFYARCSCCCGRCSCCGRCGYCATNKRGLLLANFSS